MSVSESRPIENADFEAGVRGTKISRVLSGTFMTSLDGPGFSITLLKATSEMLEYINAPTKAIGWSTPSFTPEIWEKKASRVFESENSPDEEPLVQDAGIERMFLPPQ